jgi:class 3 adenylate cyclase
VALSDDLKADVAKILADKWVVRDGQKVPEPEDVKLGNDAVRLDATVLYADLAASTKLVDRYKPLFAAKMYKSYLHAVAKVIRSEGGVITAYDGDRIMAVFIGDAKNTTAARTGLKINWVVKNVIRPAIQAQYPKGTYSLAQTVGIDTSELHVARTGIRGSNDLVWVGRAANYAAKLSDLSPDSPTWITAEVYARLRDELKAKDGKAMWKKLQWTSMGNHTIYSSTWWWSV